MADRAAPLPAIGFFSLQARNNAWAGATLWEVCAGLSPAAFAAPRPGFFGSIRRTLNHIYDIDRYYLDALENGGEGRAVFDRAEEPDAASLRTLQAAHDRRLIAYCDGLDDAALTARCVTQRPEGPVEERVDHTLLHLFQHQVHHRGQVHAMLSHAGVAPPQLDDFYLEFGRVETARACWEI